MSDRGKGAKEGAYICVSASLSTCVPWGIVKQMQHILCQPHHTTLMKKWQICLSLCLSPTHIDTNIPRQSPNVFLSALEQPVKQATGKITYWEKTLKCATLLIFGWRMPLSPVFSYICVSCDIFNFTIFNAQYNMGCCYYCMLYVCSSCKCKAPARLPVILIHAQ